MSDLEPAVWVWRNEILPGSETFIRNQTDHLKKWKPILVGAERRSSTLVRESDSVLFSDSRLDQLRRRLFYRTGRSARVRRAVAASGAPLMHAHFAPDAWLMLHTARKLKLPLLVTLHGQDITRWPNQRGIRGVFARRKLRAVLLGADRILAVSHFIARQALHFGADARTVEQHYIGIPVPAEAPAEDPAWDLLFVGRLAAKKGVADLFSAAAIVARDAPTETLRIGIIGDGTLRAELETMADRLNLDVHFLGSLTPPEIAVQLSRAKMFVAPSKRANNGDSEGFGMVFLEAAAARVPVVAYAHGGVVEAVSNGETGLLAPEGDIATLASHISRLLHDENLRVQLGSAGRKRLESEFDIVPRTAALERLYDRIAHS